MRYVCPATTLAGGDNSDSAFMEAPFSLQVPRPLAAIPTGLPDSKPKFQLQHTMVPGHPFVMLYIAQSYSVLPVGSACHAHVPDAPTVNL